MDFWKPCHAETYTIFGTTLDPVHTVGTGIG